MLARARRLPAGQGRRRRRPSVVPGRRGRRRARSRPSPPSATPVTPASPRSNRTSPTPTPSAASPAPRSSAAPPGPSAPSPTGSESPCMTEPTNTAPRGRRRLRRHRTPPRRRRRRTTRPRRSSPSSTPCPPAATALADEVQAAGPPARSRPRPSRRRSSRPTSTSSRSARPSGMHVQLAEAALAAGKHVVIEKPLDTTIARARQIAALAAAARERGLVVSVISQHRFDPAPAAVARAAHDGGFGTRDLGRSPASPGTGPRGTTTPATGAAPGQLDGGGAVMNQGVHTVDLLVWMLGRPVEISRPDRAPRPRAHRGRGHRGRHRPLRVGRARRRPRHDRRVPGAVRPVRRARHAGSAVVDDDRLAYFHIAPDTDARSAATTSNASAVDGAVDQKDRDRPARARRRRPGRTRPLRSRARSAVRPTSSTRSGRDANRVSPSTTPSCRSPRSRRSTSARRSAARCASTTCSRGSTTTWPVVGTPATVTVTEGATR